MRVRNSVSCGVSCGLLVIATACGAGAPAQVAPVGPASPAPASTSARDTTADESAPHIRAAVDAADRSADDKALDGGRHPAALLAFCGVQPGGKVAEIAAGGGYTAEIAARAVGPDGKVYGVNNKFLLGFAEQPWSARLAKPVNKNIVRVDREFDDPLPPEAKNLDVVIDNLFYHDMFWLKVDRDKMNRAILSALKPGGVYCVIDHSGRAGTGSGETQTLHRVEEKVVREEIERAGFKLAAESGVWRNPADTRDWNAAPFAAKDKRGQSDRFALKYVKP
jgi:predicted methyltransferase